MASLHFNLGLAATLVHAATFEVFVEKMRFILKFLDKLVGVFLALWSRTLIAYELFRIAGYIYRNQYGLALIDIFLKAQVTLNIMEQMMPRRHFTGPEQLQHWAIKMSHLKSYSQFPLRSLTPLDIILNSYILICLSI